MIVLGASGRVRIEKRMYSRNESLHAPHLIDLEVTQVLRRLEREETISARRSDEALQDLADLRVTRYPHLVFLTRIWELRHNVSAYDAAYVVLAERLKAPLISRDARLAHSAGHAAKIEIL